ncbi:hypothetical protein [Streptomyces sp. NPDC054961]
MPWSDDLALVVGSDDSVTVGHHPSGKGVWRTCSSEPGRRLKVLTPDDLTRYPSTYRALQARDWALGRDCGCSGAEKFASKELVLSRGPHWDVATRDALLGDWAAPLARGGSLEPSVLGRIKSEARRIHRELVPLWERTVRKSRVQLLDRPIGDGLTLHDLVPAEPRMDDLVFDTAFEDERIDTVLRGLDASERRVAMAWAHPSIGTWTEAARFAGAARPEDTGDRVRRKLQRLGKRHTERARAAAATRAGAR